MSTIVFSHGKESGPNGNKIKLLRKAAESQGHETVALDYTLCADVNERLKLLKDRLKTISYGSLILVGSSMGGYVSMVIAIDHEVDGLFLLCPAIYLPDPEYDIQDYHPRCESIELIHGWADEVVPYHNSIRFASQSKALLNLVNDNHRLSNSHAFIVQRFEAFLNRNKG